MARQAKKPLWSRILWLVILAAALAYVEASVVVYLREVLVPAREEVFPRHLRQPLPLLSKQQLDAAGGSVPSFLALEMIRELAALAVLAAAAAGFRRRRGEFMGLFFLGFGVWDLLYYAFLKLQMDWPASLATWDVLFLIPVPWVAPVWAPMAVAGTLTIAGLAALARPGRTMSPGAKIAASVLTLAGACLILVSFCWRWTEAIGGVPARFDWPWFLAGWILAAAGLAWTLTRPPAPRL